LGFSPEIKLASVIWMGISLLAKAKLSEMHILPPAKAGGNSKKQEAIQIAGGNCLNCLLL
jgi:hypothetical protein